jgi:CDP-glucose 4,6-dehydratase
MNGQPPLVRVPSQGSFKRDFLYVRDTVEAYLAMFHGLSHEEVHGQAFNFAMGGSWTVLDVVRKLQALLGREDLEPDIVPQEHGEVLHQQVSADKARRLLGWEPQYSLEEGLRETVEWYRQYLGADLASVPVLREAASAAH